MTSVLPARPKTVSTTCPAWCVEDNRDRGGINHTGTTHQTHGHTTEERERFEVFLDRYDEVTQDGSFPEQTRVMFRNTADTGLDDGCMTVGDAEVFANLLLAGVADARSAEPAHLSRRTTRDDRQHPAWCNHHRITSDEIEHRREIAAWWPPSDDVTVTVGAVRWDETPSFAPGEQLLGPEQVELALVNQQCSFRDEKGVERPVAAEVGLDSQSARRLAAALVSAADLLDKARPAVVPAPRREGEQ